MKNAIVAVLSTISLFLIVSNASASEPECEYDLESIIALSIRFDVDGNRVYLDRGSAGLEIIEKIGSEFVQLGTYMDPTGIGGVKASGNLVATRGPGASSIYLIDVSNPSEPTKAATISGLPAGEEYDGVWFDNGLLIGASKRRFEIYDVSDPANPLLISETQFPLGTHFRTTVKNGLLLTLRVNTVKVYDLSDPFSPSLITEFTRGQNISYAFDGSKLALGYTVPNQVDIELYDIVTDPASPVFLGGRTQPFDTSFYTFDGLILVGDHLLLTYGEQMFYLPQAQIFDISNPAMFQYLYQADTEFAIFNSLPLDGEYIGVVQGRLSAYDDVSTSLSYSVRYGKEYIQPVTKRDGNLIAWNRGTLLIGPDAPIESFIPTHSLQIHPDVQPGFAPRDYNTSFVESPDGYLYICYDNPSGIDNLVLYSVDIDAPGGPILLDTETYEHLDPRSMLLLNGVLYIHTISSNSFVTSELLPNGQLGPLVQVASSIYSGEEFLARNEALYLLDHRSDLSVYSLATPQSPVFSHQIEDTNVVAPAFLIGDYLYGSKDVGGGYAVFDTSNPLDPQLLPGFEVPLPADAELIAESDGILYLMTDTDMIQIDVNDPSDQRIVDVAPLSPNGTSALHYLAEGLIIEDSLYLLYTGRYSRVAEIGLEVCTDTCPADLNNDNALDFFDVSAFLTAFSNQELAADFTGDGLFDFFDVSAFLSAFAQGCP